MADGSELGPELPGAPVLLDTVEIAGVNDGVRVTAGTSGRRPIKAASCAAMAAASGVVGPVAAGLRSLWRSGGIGPVTVTSGVPGESSPPAVMFPSLGCMGPVVIRPGSDGESLLLVTIFQRESNIGPVVIDPGPPAAGPAASGMSVPVRDTIGPVVIMPGSGGASSSGDPVVLAGGGSGRKWSNGAPGLMPGGAPGTPLPGRGSIGPVVIMPGAAGASSSVDAEGSDGGWSDKNWSNFAPGSVLAGTDCAGSWMGGP